MPTMLRTRWTLALASLFLLALGGQLAVSDLEGADLAPGVRGVATRAPAGIKIDGDISEFKGAFCTPIEYFHKDLKNRPAQFFYMWDETAFYAALRTLDEDHKQANLAPDGRLWEGDAVEWYFDTRRGAGFRNRKWEKGAVHCYWTGYKDKKVQGRFCLRPGYLDAIRKIGVEVAARKTKYGAEIEFKLPWANFPDFEAKAGAVIALDAELCYSDGGPRLYRAFAFGSPLSVQQPASLGRVQLVEKLEPSHWKACGAVMMPLRCDTPWTQPRRAHVTGYMALPPDHADQIGKVVFRITDLSGKVLGEYVGEKDVIAEAGRFHRVRARWPADDATPGQHHLTGIVYDKSGKELTRVAPRLVSVNWKTGY